MRFAVVAVVVAGFVGSVNARMVRVSPAAGTLVAMRSEPSSANVGLSNRWLASKGCRRIGADGGSPWQCDGMVFERMPRRLRGVVDDVIPLGEPVDLDLRLGTEASRTSAGGAFFLSPAEFARLYGLDAVHARGIDGTGVTIGIVGLSAIAPADLATFRSGFGLPPARFDQTSTGRVPGAFQVEAMLDVSWAGAVAPGAHVRLAVGSIVVDALGALVDDPSVDLISLSVVVCPTNRTGKKLVRQAKRLFKRARRMRKTVLIASGDDGRVSCGRDAPDPFAGSPFVLTVGGTTPLPALAPDGAVVAWHDEIAWADASGASGGGVARGRRPRWARGHHGRPVPDVAYPAARMYPIVLGGRGLLVGGTSAAAPAWAGTLALAAQVHGGPLGFVTDDLHRLGRAQAQGGPVVFHDIVRSGSHPLALEVGPGYDLATGWGTPIADALIEALRAPRP